MGPPGFEPGSRTSEAQSLDHASRRSLSGFFDASVLHKDSRGRSFDGAALFGGVCCLCFVGSCYLGEK